MVFDVWGYNCVIAQDMAHMKIPATEIHHARIHNTKWSRKKYPLFINSVFNLKPVCHSFHMMNPSWGKWSEKRVKTVEDGFKRHPNHARMFNGGNIWTKL